MSMNFDHLNKVYDFWRGDILPNLSHVYTIDSFNEYLKRFSFLPSGKWLQRMEVVKLNRVGFAVDAKKFTKKYKHVCVAYNAPMKPEDGLQRIIYQISPTLHVEIALWIWVEHDELQQYASLFACYGDEAEFLAFVDDLYKKMRKEGNTEEKSIAPGFGDFASRLQAESGFGGLTSPKGTVE